MPLQHVSLPTGPTNFAAMREFYIAILAPLGYGIYFEKTAEWLGMAPKRGGPDFWLHCGGDDFPKFDGNLEKRGGKTHIAFDAPSRKAVDEWYKLAIKAGGVCNGAPGERAYVKGYYAAYVIDPIGNNVEVVHWNPLWLQALKAAPVLVSSAVGAALAIGWGMYAKAA